MVTGLKTDGTLWGWGDSSQAQFGNGVTSFNVGTPIQIGTDTDWKQITMSWSVCVALKNNGSRWGWGYNTITYNLGDGTTINRLVPTQLDTDSDWAYVDMETESQFYGGNAIKQNNSLFHWGYNISTNIRNIIPIQEGTACVLTNMAFENELFSVYPNPTSDFATIQFQKMQPSKIKILNALGQIILQEENQSESNRYTIDLSAQAAGIYYLSVETNKQTYQQKIIKQ